MSREAMKLALEALDHNMLFTSDMPGYDCQIIERAYDALLKELAEQLAQQEPVAWKDAIVVNLLREGINKHRARELADHFISLTPPSAQRTWVGLTDEEAFQICVDCGCLSEDWLTLLDAIEAKLKEKNT